MLQRYCFLLNLASVFAKKCFFIQQIRKIIVFYAKRASEDALLPDFLSCEGIEQVKIRHKNKRKAIKIQKVHKIVVHKLVYFKYFL